MSWQSEECRRVDEQLEPWAAGELEASAAAPVAAHLRRCPRCRAEAERARRVLDELRALPELAPPAGLVEALPRGEVRSQRRGRWWQAAAAAVLMAAAGGGLAWHQQQLEQRRVAAATREARYALAVVARASAAAGGEVADGLALGRLARAVDRPEVRALASGQGGGR